MAQTLDQNARDTLFHEARSLRKWRPVPIPDAVIREIYDLTILGPTSGNCCPSRFLFVVSPEVKERIYPHLSENNVPATRSAPLTVIIATDTRFWADMQPDAKMTKVFAGLPPAQQAVNGFRNGTLQGAYLIVACRALGLDTGAMSGFDNAGLDAEFFPDGRWKSNFICNIGHGDYSDIGDRPPRPDFDAVAKVL